MAADPDATIDPDATVDLEATIDPGGGVGLDRPSAENDPDKTIDEPVAMDSTVGVDETGPEESLQATLDSLVGDHPTDAKKTKAALDDSNISQTINPRELSEEEQKGWDEIASQFLSAAEPTHDKPAIERSIHEPKLRLRSRTVSTPMEESTAPVDYRLVRLLGKGGMGNVFVARQASLDRLIAVKVIRPMPRSKQEMLRKQGKLKQVEDNRRQQFLSEAVVTGDLDHPNIVPIHDVATTGDSTLFYAMKRVIGTPWSDVIGEKSRDENLEILLKAADAIGFAHTRGVIHRDIKPENIMLGDFGVVMVMDWGLALAKPEFEKLDSITPARGLGGTPSFMAPEMATGPLERVGTASDIYLLGATLFMIITGKPPHDAANVSECLRAVAHNQIRAFDARHEGELMDIALTAMASDPADRYQDVPSFQTAIRQYRSHAESIALTTRAQEDLRSAQETLSYATFARAEFGFEEAINLWSGNTPATEGLVAAKWAHAEAAYANGDFDLGLSLLDRDDPRQAEVADRLTEAIRMRQLRESRFGLLKKTAAALAAFIFVGGTAGLLIINDQRNKARENADLARQEAARAEQNYARAEAQRAVADAAKEQAFANEQRAVASERDAIASAERARRSEREARESENKAIVSEQKAAENLKLAIKNEDTANENARQAERQRLRAQQNAEEARVAQRKAEYEAYVSRIGLAKARIEQNEFEEARRIIDELIAERTGEAIPLELKWLSAVANQAKQTIDLPGVPGGLSLSGGGDRGVVDLTDGRLLPIVLTSEQRISPGDAIELPRGDTATASVIRGDGRQFLVGTALGDVQVWDWQDGRPAKTKTLSGHQERITGLQYAGEDRIVSASRDKTVRVWDVASRQSEAVMWHIAPVVGVAVAGPGANLTIASAVADKSMGRVVLWSLDGSDRQARRRGAFTRHDAPVTSLALAPDGTFVVSGDASGQVLKWSTEVAESQNLERLISGAVDRARTEQQRSVSDPASDRQAFVSLVDPSLSKAAAHDDSVRRLQLSADGTGLLSCGDDYLIKLWRLSPEGRTDDTDRLVRKLRGHGGAVVQANFVAASTETVLSAAQDESLRLWDTAAEEPQAHRPAATPRHRWVSTSSRAGGIAESNESESHRAAARDARVHDDEIWSARFSPAGDMLVTASRDRTAKVLSIDPRTLSFETVAELDADADEGSPKPGTDRIGEALLDEGTSFRALSMAVDVTGRRLLVGGGDAVVRIWSLERGTELGTAVRTGLNNTLAVSRDGRLLVTGANDPDLRAVAWTLGGSGNVTAKRLHEWAGHEEALAAVAIAPDKRVVATADRAGRVILWDTTTGRMIGKPIDDRLGTRINDVAFDSDGSGVWIAADDQRLSRLDVNTGTITRRLDHDGFVTTVSLSPDGRFAVTIAELQKIADTVARATLWDLTTERSRTLATLTWKRQSRSRAGGRPGIVSGQWEATSKQFAVAIVPPGDGRGRVERWKVADDLESAKRISRFELPSKIGDISHAVPLGDDALITLHGSAAFRWNTETMTHETSYRTHGAVTRAEFSPDGRFVMTASRSVKVWDWKTGVAIGKLETPHEGAVRGIAFVPRSTPENKDDTYRLATGGDDGRVRLWTFDARSGRFRGGRDLRRPDVPNRATGRSLCLSFSPSGDRLLWSTDLGDVRVHHMRSGRSAVLMSDPRSGSINVARFSPDGRWVACGGDDRLARVWNVDDVFGQRDPPEPILFRGHAEAIKDLVCTETTTRRCDC